MRILMVTNTFTPHVGGVARSVQSFRDALCRAGHEVMVAAPEFDGAPADEPGVVRFPAWKHFHHSDFSIPMPVPGRLARHVRAFAPDLVHSHHPFLLGHTALRIAAQHGLPVVFTHHTMYERYTHYLPLNSRRLQRFAVELAVGYCNLCDAVVAPSSTVAECLRQRGVKTPVRVIPTGVEVEHFQAGNGHRFRQHHQIPQDALLLGYLGRLSAEKNLGFLSRVVSRFLQNRPDSHWLVAGQGPAREIVQAACAAAGVGARLHLAGVLQREELADAYRAMDAFVFASQSETQGMVLAEAMAAGTPVVAVDAPGVRDIVRDGCNGRLLATEDEGDFLAALAWLAELPAAERRRLADQAAATARRFSMANSVAEVLHLYGLVLDQAPRSTDNGAWRQTAKRLEEEWKILYNIAQAVNEALRSAAPSGPEHAP